MIRQVAVVMGKRTGCETKEGEQKCLRVLHPSLDELGQTFA